MNAAHLIGVISEYGVRLSYTEAAKPQASFTLVVEEPGRDGATYRIYVPVLVVGGQAEECAASLEAGERLAVSGRLAWKAGRTKEAGKLVVTCFGVERLAPAPEMSAT